MGRGNGRRTVNEWRDRAACKGRTDLVPLFFPNGKASPQVKMFCAACPVNVECRAFGENHANSGVWGGVQLDLKGRVPDGMRLQAKVAECGTASGYRKHTREGTATCAPCRAAHQAENRKNVSASREAARRAM